MSFVRASTFNYSNLHEEDKKIADEMIQMIFEINARKLFYTENKQLPTQTQLSNKLKLEGLEVATQVAVDQTIAFICNTINAYDKKAEDIDTDDHFFGAAYSENLFKGLNILTDSRFSFKKTEISNNE